MCRRIKSFTTELLDTPVSRYPGACTTVVVGEGLNFTVHSFYRYYGYIMANFLEPKLQQVADLSSPCLTIIFNCVVSQHSLSPPLKLPCNRRPAPSSDSGNTAQERVACLNMAVNAFGYMPLLYSQIRLDPVLFKDNVSVYRKEYRRMEAS